MTASEFMSKQHRAWWAKPPALPPEPVTLLRTYQPKPGGGVTITTTVEALTALDELAFGIRQAPVPGPSRKVQL